MPTGTLLKPIKKLHARLDALHLLQELRLAIAEVIGRNLDRCEDDLNLERSMHFQHAITALELNIRAQPQPTNAWLRLCLADLERAVISVGGNDAGTEANANLSRSRHHALKAALAEVLKQL